MNGGALRRIRQRLYSVASLLRRPVDIGGAIGGSGFVPMTNNGTQVNIVHGTNSYIYSIASGFQVVTDSNFHATVSTTFSTIISFIHGLGRTSSSFRTH